MPDKYCLTEAHKSISDLIISSFSYLKALWRFISYNIKLSHLMCSVQWFVGLVIELWGHQYKLILEHFIHSLKKPSNALGLGSPILPHPSFDISFLWVKFLMAVFPISLRILLCVCVCGGGFFLWVFLCWKISCWIFGWVRDYAIAFEITHQSTKTQKYTKKRLSFECVIHSKPGALSELIKLRTDPPHFLNRGYKNIEFLTKL